MPITVEAKCGAVAKAMKSLGEIATGKINVPILNHIKLTAENGQLDLCACDTNRELRMTIEAAVGSNGSTCLPAQALRALVGNWGSDSGVVIDGDDSGRCIVRSGRSRYRLADLPAEDFPFLGRIDEAFVSVTLAGKDLAGALSRVSWAMEDDRILRPEMCGIYIHTEGRNPETRRIVFVATTGTVLARWEMDSPGDIDHLSYKGVVIPDSSLPIIGRMCEVGDVMLMISDRKLTAVCNGIRFTTKLIDGTFPEYQRIIPEACEDRSMIVDRVSMISCLKRLEAVGSDNVVKIEPSENGIKVSPSKPSQVGEGDEDIEAEAYGDIKFAVSRNFITPALQAFTGELVRVEQEGFGFPIRLVGPLTDNGLTIIVMPALA